MIVNIMDERTNSHTVHVDAVIEPTMMDHKLKDSAATYFNRPEIPSWYVQYQYSTTIPNAIEDFNEITGDIPVTLFLYDEGSEPLF